MRIAGVEQEPGAPQERSTNSPEDFSWQSTGTGSQLDRLESWLDLASDHVNPILVKESRQSLKSRQFLITFTLLLVLAVCWTFLAVALLTPAIYLAPAGKYVLSGYYWILLFPLVVIVPFTAFRSLATEREDGTYELLSITTLPAQQIVAGKLGSAMLQMMVYLSALAPCIAFTYLLRGVDIALIVIAIVGAFMLSVLLSAIGLLLATLANARHIQVVLSVVLILALAGTFFAAGGFFTGMVFSSGITSFTDPNVLFALGGISTAWACALALVYFGATARIQFLADNRSTPLRVIMFVSMLCLIGWCSWYGIVWNDLDDSSDVIIVCSLIFWGIMGSFMVGERPDLSPRVRRALPKTFLGRVCLTWFQPGPGPGYFFAVTNMFACSIVAIGISLSTNTPASRREWTISAAVAAVCYIAAYLGFGRLLVKALRRREVEGPLLSFLLHVVLVALGVIVPLILQYSIYGTSQGYTALQVSNPFWTMDELGRNSPYSSGWDVSLAVLGQAAILMIVVNFVLLSKDLMPVRTLIPQRILDEDQRHVENKHDPTPSGPWSDSSAGNTS